MLMAVAGAVLMIAALAYVSAHAGAQPSKRKKRNEFADLSLAWLCTVGIITGAALIVFAVLP
jgi:hypothetical protein